MTLEFREPCCRSLAVSIILIIVAPSGIVQPGKQAHYQNIRTAMPGDLKPILFDALPVGDAVDGVYVAGEMIYDMLLQKLQVSIFVCMTPSAHCLIFMALTPTSLALGSRCFLGLFGCARTKRIKDFIIALVPIA